jgi:hypothetical protein
MVTALFWIEIVMSSTLLNSWEFLSVESTVFMHSLRGYKTGSDWRLYQNKSVIIKPLNRNKSSFLMIKTFHISLDMMSAWYLENLANQAN